MAHVRGEAGLALDAFLEGVGHAVERGRQRRELGVVGRHQAGVEASSRDGLGRGSRPPPGAAAGDRWPNARPQRRPAVVTRAAPGQGEGQDPKRPLQLGQREDLEIGASTLGTGTPTTIWGELFKAKSWFAGVPPSTRVRIWPGMAFSPTEIDVAYHWPRSSITDNDPGKVSRESRSWVDIRGWANATTVRANEALTYAWRRMAVSRSCRMNWRAVK